MREIEVDNVVDDNNGVDDNTEITDNGWDVAVALNVIFVNFGTWQPQSLPAGMITFILVEHSGAHRACAKHLR